MANKNDAVILELKKQIATKKEILAKTPRFNPKTNCMLRFDDINCNLQALSGEDLVLVMIKLNSIRLSAEDLGLADTLCISGFSVNDWLDDMKGKLAHLSRKQEELKLRGMESKLEKMLSDDKKVELELESIAEMLK